MASWAIRETFHRVAVQPGSTPKSWDKKELVRCCATGTGIKTKLNLKGKIHPVFDHWVTTNIELLRELEQPLLLASKILEAVGLPWTSDFLVDDIFDAQYPGRAACHGIRAAFSYGQRGTPYSIIRHHRSARTTEEQRTRWTEAARQALRGEFAQLVRWQIDHDMFQTKGWNGYTCRHPRVGFHLDDLDRYETIKKFDSFSTHEGSRNLTILVMAEYPAHMAELRRQGKAQSEEYLLTAFMATVTILHELGHAIYWKDRRALTRDLCEPFYGADLEMELGDSFVAAIFGGWVPVSIRGLDGLKRDFSFADGVAWRQALNWGHHRIRPKYRAHYSIRVDYIARLFQEKSWSESAAALIRPRLLTGNSLALRSLDLRASLARAGQHATAAIADFHHDGGEGCVWNRRPGAWFRFPQFDGSVYPELELPTAPANAICEPMAREYKRRSLLGEIEAPSSMKQRMIIGGSRDAQEKGIRVGAKTNVSAAVPATIGMENGKIETADGVGRRVGAHGTWSSSSSEAKHSTKKQTPQKVEFSPRKSSLANRIPQQQQQQQQICRAVSSSGPLLLSSPTAVRPELLGLGLGFGLRTTAPRTRDRAQTLLLHKTEEVPVAQKAVVAYPKNQDQEDEEDEDDEDTTNFTTTNDSSGADRGEISVEELKKRLSRLIGVSLAELEKLFDDGAA